MKTTLLLLLTVVAASLLATSAHAAPSRDITSGLCIVVPATDGAALCELTHHGQVSVHGLATDDATVARVRSAIYAAGLYGVAAVSRPIALTPLPYADNLANLVIVDRDALGAAAPTQAEILRVVAPNGTARIHEHGAWTDIVKPRPPEMDDWTHFDYDAAGSGASHDKLVGPPTNVQWRMELQEYWGLGGNPAGYRPFTGFRLAGGRAFFVYNADPRGAKSGRDNETYAVGRDAYNGLPIWKVHAISPGVGTPQEYEFVASDDRLFTFLEQGAPAVALDAKSGAVLRTYDKGVTLPKRGEKVSPGYTMLRHAGNLLIETGQDKLVALDVATGDVKWTYTEPDRALAFPRVLEKERRVLAEVAEANVGKIETRWASLNAFAVVCLDLDTGKVIWRNADIQGTRLGQTIQSGDKVYGFCPAGIGAGQAPRGQQPQGVVVCLDARTGKTLSRSEHFPWGYNLIVRDGQAFFATPDTLNAVDMASGQLAPFWRAPFNNRCNRTAATDGWVIMGLGIYVDRAGTATVKGIARSGCAQGAFPANGMTYYTPNTCWCFAQLRGHLALSSEPTRKPLPDDVRLQKPSGEAAGAFAGKPTSTEGPIASEWAAQIENGATETPPVNDGARQYVSIIHEQRVVCREGEKTLWSFTAGGRVSQPPVLNEGHLLFGSHDGYVYCLNALDGKLLWRFLGAPTERNIVSHGQVESSWPVYNVVMHGGNACFTAGLHPETGGGIQAWGLNPATGAIVWHKLLRRSPVVGKAGIKIAPNRIVNSPLTSDGQKLSIVGLSFSPSDSDESIQQVIDFQSLGDKNRTLGWTIRGTEVKQR